MSKGIVAFGCARYNEGDTDLLFDAVKEIYLRSLSVRNGGSAALDLCYIAAGRVEIYCECRLRPWDYAAGSLILQEAGGCITTLEGEPLTLSKRHSVLAAGEGIYREILQLVQRA